MNFMYPESVNVDLNRKEIEMLMEAIDSQIKFFTRCANNPLPSGPGPAWWRSKLESMNRIKDKLLVACEEQKQAEGA